MIREIRNTLEISQNMLGKGLGVSGGTVARWEKGRKIPLKTEMQLEGLYSLLKQMDPGKYKNLIELLDLVGVDGVLTLAIVQGVEVEGSKAGGISAFLKAHPEPFK